jgi:hypothetical protein
VRAGHRYYERRQKTAGPLMLTGCGFAPEPACGSRFLPSQRSVREKPNVDRGKESDDQACADDQHNQRRSIEKARSRLDRCLDHLSIFFVHESAPWVGPLCDNRWVQNRFRRAKNEAASPSSLRARWRSASARWPEETMKSEKRNLRLKELSSMSFRFQVAISRLHDGSGGAFWYRDYHPARNAVTHMT